MNLSVATLYEDHALKFFMATAERMKIKNPVKNPFSSKVHISHKGDKLLFIAKIESYWFEAAKFAAYGWVAAVVILSLLHGGLVNYWWLNLIGYVVAVFLFTSTHSFMFLIMKLGLRKAGYKGKIELLSSSETLGALLFEQG